MGGVRILAVWIGLVRFRNDPRSVQQWNVLGWLPFDGPIFDPARNRSSAQ